MAGSHSSRIEGFFSFLTQGESEQGRHLAEEAATPAPDLWGQTWKTKEWFQMGSRASQGVSWDGKIFRKQEDHGGNINPQVFL